MNEDITGVKTRNKPCKGCPFKTTDCPTNWIMEQPKDDTDTWHLCHLSEEIEGAKRKICRGYYNAVIPIYETTLSTEDMQLIKDKLPLN